MKTTVSVVLLCLGWSAAEAQEITSRASVGLALTSSATTTIGGAGTTAPRERLTTDNGIQASYAIELSFGGDAALQVGLSAMHVPAHLAARGSSSLPPGDDGLNLAMLTVGVAYHVPVKRWDVRIAPFAAFTAPTMLVFEQDVRLTTLTIPERATWGVEGGVSHDLGRSSFAADVSVRYTDLHLRLTGDASGRLSLRPLALSVGLVYRH